MRAMSVTTNNGNAAGAFRTAATGGDGSALDAGTDLERLRSTLGALPAAREHPALVVLVGPPGTGKTTIARAVHERTPVVVLDGEEIRHELFDVPDYSFRESQRVDRAVRTLIGELLAQRQAVILDDSNLTEWERQPLYTLAARHHARLVLVEVTTPTRVVIDRIRHLAVRSPQDTEQLESVYSRMAGRQEPIARPHLRVDTSHDVRPVVEEIVREIEVG